MQKHIENKITKSHPRKMVRVTCGDDLVLEGPTGTTVEDFLINAQQHMPELFKSPFIAAIVDGRLRELTYPMQRDATLRPVLLNSSDGGRIYRRSLVMLLAVAATELWPGAQVSVSYAIADGGFYCTLNKRQQLNTDEIQQLEAHMRQIVEADEPIHKQIVSLEEARALFAARDEQDKVRLLEQRSKEQLTLYTLRGQQDYNFGYMVPSTGYLQHFRLLPSQTGGFILQYPLRDKNTSLGNITADTKLTTVFQEAEEWLSRLGVEDIGQLNHIVRQDHVHELILIAEALHEQRVARIASEIHNKYYSQQVRVVLIAGPSSSGKTTFSKRLAIQLLAHGLHPFTLELDNFFVDREKTPRDENGEYDFEALEAVNLPLFNESLLKLIHGDKVQLPRFDFIAGKSVAGREVQLSKDQIIIVEGIHGLNPDLVAHIPQNAVYRIYVSALTQLNIDMHNRVGTTDVRLLRRIVRDARGRGYMAADTLQRWESVRRGERRNIFPYQENADVMFNSALAYELAALKPLAEPLLLQVEYATKEHIEANRLLSFLNWVQPLSPIQQQHIPDTSLLREFIGGSSLSDYHP